MQRVILSIAILLLLGIPSQAQGVPIYLPVVIKMASNNWYLVKPKASYNYVLNPSAETTGNFSDVSGGTTTRSTDYQKYGLYSYNLVAAAAGDGTQLTLSALSNTEHYATVRVRAPHPPLQVKISSTTKNLDLLQKIDESWNLYGAPFSAGQANGATAVQILATGAGDFYFDGVQVEPLAYPTTYIDGTQDGCLWQGPEHASISERVGESRAGGIVQDFWADYGFHIQKIVGAGPSPRDLTIDNYAILPGGELNNAKIQPRQFTIVGKFVAKSEEDLHQNRQALAIELSGDSYPGKQPFRIRFGGGRILKEISGYYQGGLESELAAFYGAIETTNDSIIRRDLFTENAAIQIVATDPRWYEVGESAALLDTNDSATFRGVAGRLRSTGQWDPLGPPSAISPGGFLVLAIAEDPTYVYIAGSFTNFDGIGNADGIVRYNKATGVYSALGTGTSSAVRSLAIGPDGTLYAAGDFTSIGGTSANRIAAWNGSSWSALGSGVNNTIYAIAVGLDGTIYVTGDLTTAGGGAAAHVAAWDGSAWSALGSGLDDYGLVLAIGLDGTLYAGGAFTTAGGVSADYVAAWDGDAWSALGSGLSDEPSSISTGATGLIYIGGTFETAGGITVNGIAAWNGSSWSALGSGANSGTDVTGLSTAPDGLLYASGAFTEMGGVAISDHIAKWNGSSWGQLDIDLPGSPTYFVPYASKYTDPTSLQKYDFFIGYNSTGTGNYGGSITVINQGSVPVFPKIVVTRSGGTSVTLATLRNEKSAKEILFSYSMLDNETLTINLAPTKRTITSSYFGSRLDAKLPGNAWGTWSLLPGSNQVTSFGIASGSPTVTAYMLWRAAFDGYD